jgi:hypothetical protein
VVSIPPDDPYGLQAFSEAGFPLRRCHIAPESIRIRTQRDMRRRRKSKFSVAKWTGRSLFGEDAEMSQFAEVL